VLTQASQRAGVGGWPLGEDTGAGVTGTLCRVGIAAGSMPAEESSAASASTGATEALSGPDTSGADAGVAVGA
jgi:hypothetical protein